MMYSAGDSKTGSDFFYFLRSLQFFRKDHFRTIKCTVYALIHFIISYQLLIPHARLQCSCPHRIIYLLLGKRSHESPNYSFQFPEHPQFQHFHLL